TIAIVALIIVVARQNGRIGLLEREIGALRSFVLASAPAPDARIFAPTEAQDDISAESAPGDEIVAETAAAATEAAPAEAPAHAGPWTATASASATEAIAEP